MRIFVIVCMNIFINFQLNNYEKVSTVISGCIRYK